MHCLIWLLTSLLLFDIKLYALKCQQKSRLISNFKFLFLLPTATPTRPPFTHAHTQRMWETEEESVTV